MLDYKKVLPSFYLEEYHKRALVEWIIGKVTRKAQKWLSMIFTDDKIFNIDGSDDSYTTGTISGVERNYFLAIIKFGCIIILGFFSYCVK